MLQYLKKKHDKMIMGADSIIQLCIWVDVTHGVQLYIKRHNVNGISFGYGMVHFKPGNQKLNTKISTEVEVVNISD